MERRVTKSFLAIWIMSRFPLAASVRRADGDSRSPKNRRQASASVTGSSSPISSIFTAALLTPASIGEGSDGSTAFVREFVPDGRRARCMMTVSLESPTPVIGIEARIVSRHFKTQARVLVVPLSDGFESALRLPRDDLSRRHGRLLSIVNTRLGTFRRALFVLVKNEAAILRL